MMRKNPTVAIIYGLAEGGYHGRKVTHALKRAGFAVTSDVGSADCIIAHSGGCYLVPNDSQAKVVLDIGYCYWPTRGLLDSLRAKLADEYHRNGLLAWLLQGLIHSLYILNLRHTWRLARGWPRRANYLEELGTRRIVFIRNQSDPYCNPTQLLAAAGPAHKYVSLPGYHDHVWDTPEPYAELLRAMIQRS